MKNTFVYLIFALGFLSSSCNFSEDVQDLKPSSGRADFTIYVALGNSLTAGFQDGALYISGQENSYPAIIARGMGITYDFNQPLMADDLGGIPAAGRPNKFVLSLTENGLFPTVAQGEAKTTLANIYEGKPFHNLGVPGAKVAHLLAPGYGNPAGLVSTPKTANPYYVRFASSPQSSVIADALATKPTFFSLWIGNNDILFYAMSGGNNSEPLTSSIDFTKYYTAIVNQLTESGAKGVLANIPYVSTIPFFNTIPNNALILNADQATKLTAFFAAIQQYSTQMLIAQGVPENQAEAIASQYGIQFHEGDNRFLIATEKTGKNPLGFRQMSEEELLVLTIDRAAMQKEGYGSVHITPELTKILDKLKQGQLPTQEEKTKILAAIKPIADKDALDAEELAKIKSYVEAYNKTIESIAKEKDLALVDIKALMKTLATEGLRINGVGYNSKFIEGGAFSLDGVHPNQRGYAIVANAFIDAINKKYNATISKVDPNSYKGITFP